jgi:hypothetical protein
VRDTVAQTSSAARQMLFITGQGLARQPLANLKLRATIDLMDIAEDACSRCITQERAPEIKTRILRTVGCVWKSHFTCGNLLVVQRRLRCVVERVSGGPRTADKLRWSGTAWACSRSARGEAWAGCWLAACGGLLDEASAGGLQHRRAEGDAFPEGRSREAQNVGAARPPPADWGGGRSKGEQRGCCCWLVLHRESQHHGSGLVGSRIMAPDPE